MKRKQGKNEGLFFCDFITEKEASGLSKQSIINYKKVYAAYKSKTTRKLSHGFNDDAEIVVLGSAILSNEALFKILSLLVEDDFYEGKHQLIFRAIFNLYKKSFLKNDMIVITKNKPNLKRARKYLTLFGS